MSNRRELDFSSPISDRFDDRYFQTRIGNDPLRQAMFDVDATYMRNWAWGGKICDVGCSTGEFLRHIGWPGECFGMEVNSYARELASDIIRFDKDIFNTSCYFDCIVFRGTIQHVDQPFLMMKNAFTSLRPGGFLIFLSTPNTNSPYYRATKTLPFLDPPRNLYVPDDIGLTNALRNLGFDIIDISYPYYETPYAKPLFDHFRYLVNLFFRRQVLSHPFPKSMMSIVAARPDD
jgi:SAM-dependent methyltransferase